MSESEILTTLQSLNPSKSSGPDGIPSRLLKELAPEISSSITCIFNKSLYEGSFPSNWKDCKADQKDIVSNYRGIALLPILSKVLERHVHTRLYHHVSDFLNVNQHGFRQHRSCVTQLLQFVHSTAKSLDAGIQTDVIYVDMAKAFDKVPHEKLLYKLEMVGVRGQLLAWFRSYLTNRRHRTVIEGYASDRRYVPPGVPQGSIIGPLLFLIFVNDITVNIDADTNMPLYADDAKCFRELLSLDDHDALQKDLYSIEDWSDLYRYVL